MGTERIIKQDFETEFEYWVRARSYHEISAIQVLKGTKSLSTVNPEIVDEETQKKKNIFLFKYHEFYYNYFNSLINNSYVKS